MDLLAQQQRHFASVAPDRRDHWRSALNRRRIHFTTTPCFACLSTRRNQPGRPGLRFLYVFKGPGARHHARSCSPLASANHSEQSHAAGRVSFTYWTRSPTAWTIAWLWFPAFSSSVWCSSWVPRHFLVRHSGRLKPGSTPTSPCGQLGR
jgi:hypothetical protein